MKSQYYTPSLNEFRIGFEYQVVVMGIWITTRHDGYVDLIKGHVNEFGDFYDSIEEYITAGIVRVKYLDQQDIEDCGFTPVGSLWFEKKECLTSNGKNHLDCLVRMWQYHEMDIYINRGDETELIFRGNIRNKSEFKQILKMIGAE